jgi:gliding motility-associated-like protein
LNKLTRQSCFGKSRLSRDRLRFEFHNLSQGYRAPGDDLVQVILFVVVLKFKNRPNRIYFPNAFSPNNDGRNDGFKPFVTGDIIAYDFRIFNRWGQLIFQAKNPLSSWNGINKNSKPDTGSFVWICNYQFRNEKAVVQKGTVVLLW